MDEPRFDFGDEPARRGYEPNLDEVREDLAEILAAARAVSEENVWDLKTYKYNKIVFPQMSKWLPDEEREQLCFEFFRELERIELLMAA